MAYISVALWMNLFHRYVFKVIFVLETNKEKEFPEEQPVHLIVILNIN